ncbi:Quinone oxidoreductase [Lachnellula occidentalis]|uniref:Quinone oxidoreductase n=1 Tax=Lachnellula occidentalis TaxID=215460 RepID=A0A8H8RKM5_9HELO|nr:Quinone oxidoreductase [Lachnellula occidentalis]
MVKIAVAGGTGSIAREIIDVLVATKKHDILILSRKDPAAVEVRPGVTWAKTDYTDKAQLTSILHGVHTVLAFNSPVGDPNSMAQRNVIGASIAAGVKRFAPNEWSSSKFDELPWYAEKAKVRAYLEEINKEKKVLEYTLFQPGLIVDYLAPAGNLKYLKVMPLWINFQDRRGITLSDAEATYTLTTMADIANVVARAIEYKGEWPVVGGIRGTTMSDTKLLEIGAKVRGGKFDISSLQEADVRAGDIRSSWLPKFKDPNVPPEQSEEFSKIVVKGSLLSGVSESWVVSDEWNRLLPDYKFKDVEEYLEEQWAGQA